MRRFAPLAALVFTCVACGELPEGDPSAPIDAPHDGAILTLGDSIFDFHDAAGRDIPEVIGAALGRAVVDRSQGGAQFAPVEFEDDDPGFDIRRQYVDGDWSWVVLDGGGNDVNDQCGCGDCAQVIDRLIGEDGLEGEIPDFVRRVVDRGSRVLYVGYYDIPDDAMFGFDRCRDELAEHSARLRRMADAIVGAYFVSAGEVVSADARAMYDDDGVHPSVQGSRVVGRHVAATIAAVEDAAGP